MLERSHRPARVARIASPTWFAWACHVYLPALLACIFTARAAAQLLPKAPVERCEPLSAPTPSASEWLRRAAELVLPASSQGRVLRFRAALDVPLWEQSDRMYEPFVPNPASHEYWYDPATGNVARQRVERPLTPGQRAEELFTAAATFRARDTTLLQVPPQVIGGGLSPSLIPWRVLREWQARASEVRVVQRCLYHDFPRIVLALGDDRLYLTESDGNPIKLDRTEAHYLWGQVRVEYLWNTWWEVTGGGRYPLASFASYEGTTYQRMSPEFGSVALVPADSAPSLATPSSAPIAPVPDYSTPDTIRVSEHTWLLRTRAYTHAITLQRDTLYLFDATTSEARSRGDSAWIAKLFPGRHPMVLVVTDLAWPHISGVRYWVARGAAVVSHRMSADFLRRVVDRRWTMVPDQLERDRSHTRLRLTLVADSLKLAGGAIVVYAMRGFSTEGAVAAWVASERFLWAGDYVQPTSVSPYAKDVVRTARALGLTPVKVGAQHAPLTDWSALEGQVGVHAKP